MAARTSLAIAAALGCLLLTAVGARAQSASFAWDGELVSFDQAAGTLTIRAQARENATRFLQRSKPGDRLVIIWENPRTAASAAQTVLAVAAPDQVRFIDAGYITRGEFVAADAGATTVTFRVKAPPVVLQTAATVEPGRWLRLASPTAQPGPDAVLTAAAPAEKPITRLQTPPRAVAAPQAPRAASIIAPVKANGGISGTWELRYKDHNSVSHFLACELAQDGAQIGGSCDEPGRGSSPVSGSATGAGLELQIPPGGTTYVGTADAAGRRISGTLVYLGVELRFDATKNE